MLKDVIDNGEYTLIPQLKGYAKSLAQKEEEIGKPLYEMTKEEVKFILSDSDNATAVFRKISVGSDYIDWLLSTNQIKSGGSWKEVRLMDVDISEGVKRNYFPNFDAIVPRFRDCVVGSYTPAITALLWVGIPISSIPKLMNNDIYFSGDGMVIIQGDKHFLCNNHMVIEIIQNYIACPCREMFYNTGVSDYIPLYTDGHFLKKIDYRNKQDSGYIPYVADALVRAIRKDNIAASYVYASGRYYRLREEGDQRELSKMMQKYFLDYATFLTWKKVFYGE